MRPLFWLLALFSLAVLLAIAGRYNTGYALFALPPWRIEVSLNLLFIAAVALFTLGYVMLRLVVKTLRMPRAVRAHRVRVRRERAAQALRESLRLLLEGRFGQALSKAEEAFKGGESPGLAALLAARSARGMNNEVAETAWLARAQSHDEDIRAARLMTEAELHADARRFGPALESLNALQEGGQRHIAAQRLALRVHQALGNGGDVVRVARQLEKHHALGHDQGNSIKRRAHLENLDARRGDARQLGEYWAQVPAAERRDANVAAMAARLLIGAGDSVAAQRIVEAGLDAEWDDGLVALYGECGEGDALDRIARAEKWLEKRPQDAALLLTLGRLCRLQQLWGKAQSYFEASLAVAPSRSAHLELADLLDRLERADDANRHYRAAARME